MYVTSGYLYPALLALLVPFRSYILARCFSADDLVHLDPADQTSADFEKEHHAVDAAMRSYSFDEDDHHMIGRGEFRVNEREDNPRKRPVPHSATAPSDSDAP